MCTNMGLALNHRVCTLHTLLLAPHVTLANIKNHSNKHSVYSTQSKLPTSKFLHVGNTTVCSKKVYTTVTKLTLVLQQTGNYISRRNDTASLTTNTTSTYTQESR